MKCFLKKAYQVNNSYCKNLRDIFSVLDIGFKITKI